MDLRHLTTFLTIARLGSFVKAAEELNYAQSTITLHIQELEKELETRLFNRTRGTITLTEVGQALERSARRIVGEVDSLRQSVSDLSSGEGGRVWLGAIEPMASLRLPPILTRFSQERPRVELSMEVGGTNFISERVAKGELDFGICSPPAFGSKLSFTPLFREKMALLVPSKHAFATIASVNGNQLSGQRLLVTEETCAYRQAYEKALGEIGITPPSVIEIGSVRALLSAVQAGLGAAVVPVSGATPPPHRTVLRGLDGVDLGLTIGIVRRAGGFPLGSAAEALLSSIEDRLSGDGDKFHQEPKRKTRQRDKRGYAMTR